MTTYTFSRNAHFDGPADSFIEAWFEITFTHLKAEPENNVQEGITIDSIEIAVGAEPISTFNGNHDDPTLIEACWQHVKDERERVEAERDERGRL